MLGTGLDPRYVVTFLEFMLAVYSVRSEEHTSELQSH